MMVKVDVDPGAGFCFGVDQVIKTAETLLQSGETLYGLGDMVHNSEEIKRLEDLGLSTIRHEQLGSLKSAKVLFRAHGEPPSTYKQARQSGIEIIDGTCPIVIRLQKKLRAIYEAMDHDLEQVVIFGKPDHPETIGLMGQVNGDAVVVSTVADVPDIDPQKKTHLFSQTTMDPDLFREVEIAIQKHVKSVSADPDEGVFKSDCSICGEMKKRKPGLSAFAGKYDLVLFVSGKNSSNGKMLYEYCKSMNPETYWISNSSEINPQWLLGKKTIGISGATSTSINQLEMVCEQVKKLTNS